MKSRVKLPVIVLLTCIVTVCNAHEIAVTSAGLPAAMMAASDTSNAPSFPYFAEITTDDVYIRTGPGTGFYRCGKFQKGDKIQVIGSQFTWSEIIPPAGSFSWISMQYVEPNADDPTIGTVTGDYVRVWAGSEYVRPENSTKMQVKLNKGDKVKLTGEQLGDYYKIAPPPGAHLWVSTQYSKPIATPIGATPRLAIAPGIDLADETETTMDANATPMELITETEEAPKSVAETELERFYTLQKDMETEQAKPMEQQDYTTIKEALLEIANNDQAGKAARYAEATVKKVEDFELAIEVNKTVKLQNENLKKTMDGIDKARSTKLLEIKDMGKYAVIGVLENFMTYGPGHYRIVDDTGVTICTAFPGEQASGRDFDALVGKQVGLIGKIEPYKQTAGALVRFNEVVSLED
jgi:uncharacterized protein YgiM (DUF1202 family)